MSLYHDLILDHCRNPRNFKVITPCSHHAEAKNPTCGDRLSMDIVVTSGIITDIGFQGEGCAISQASASLLTEHVKGKSVDEARSLDREDMLALLGIELSPVRLKCALLSVETLKKALG